MQQRVFIGLQPHEAKPVLLIGQRPAHRCHAVLAGQRLQLEQRGAAHQRPVHIVKRILCRRADKDNGALLDGGQQRILPGAVETVHLIQKQNRLRAVQRLVALGSVDHLPHILYRGFNRIQPNKFALRMIRNNMGQRRFAAARRAIQQNGRDLVSLDRPAQQLAPPDNMLLSNIFIETLRTHAVGKQPAASGIVTE
ncbi:hypothetical protein D3C76_1217310 [compost metagenome]